MINQIFNYRGNLSPITLFLSIILNRIILFIILFVIINIDFLINHSEAVYGSKLLLEILLIVLIIFLCIVIILLIYSIYMRKLTIISSGIIYNGLRFTMYAEWNDIVWINRRSGEIIVNNPEIVAPSWRKFLMKIGGQKSSIPMSIFDINWLDHNIGKYILDHITDKNLKRMNEKTPWRI
jgi:hypothetical protein